MGARALGIVRVSQVKGREGDSFASPAEQRERIAQACERDGMVLLKVVDELDVSGGTPLAKRAGLRGAVETIEAGAADVLVAAYFDRLVRSLKVQAEVVERVEAAGGRVLALDVGAVTNGTAGQWLSATLLGTVAEYYRRSSGERVGAAQARAVARGVPTYPNVPPGYVRGAGGTLERDPRLAAVVADMFERRAAGATIGELRDFLRAHGIARSAHGVQSMLASRVYLGELHFGALHNLTAHEPIVDRATWQRVQRVRTARGPRPKSERLLARLGVLRCGTCDARMVVGSANHGGYPLYRCPPNGDCPRRVTVSAKLVERVVVETVCAELADVEGRASAAGEAQAAELAAERAQADLDAAVRAFAGLEDEASVRERLGELRERRDRARDRADELRGTRTALTVSVDDWDRLTVDERRALVRAVVARVMIAPGRGAGRVRVELVGE
jgi:site-specific DNA recombinase